jgi:hypothetical protein
MAKPEPPKLSTAGDDWHSRPGIYVRGFKTFIATKPEGISINTEGNISLDDMDPDQFLPFDPRMFV